MRIFVYVLFELDYQHGRNFWYTYLLNYTNNMGGIL